MTVEVGDKDTEGLFQMHMQYTNSKHRRPSVL